MEIAEKKLNLVDIEAKRFDYLTPDKILDPVRAYFLEVTGNGIELDPVTTPDNPTKADTFWHEGSLDRLWCHPEPLNTFVNPPYGSEIKAWVSKIGSEAVLGGAHMLTILPGQRFEQRYWQRALFNKALTGICCVTSRVTFLRPDGTKMKNNPYGSQVYCFNGDADIFVKVFKKLGMVVIPKEIHQHEKP